MTESVKLLSRPVNFAVVQLPERQYPGVVVQGDTLNGLVDELGRMKSTLEKGDLEELRWAIENMREQLSDALEFYKSTCKSHSISPPLRSRTS
jgi:hypothetical protein